jgi:ribosomal protein S18 acetylase RimI-like enzyme
MNPTPASSELISVPMDEVDEGALIECFNESFDGYVAGSVRLDASTWPVFLRRQGIDTTISRVALAQGAPVAFAFVSDRRAHIGHEGAMRRVTRLCTMGAVPSWRGRGAARVLLDESISRARERGSQCIELEVFAQNPRAMSLYVSRGFETQAELFGYERECTPPLAGTAHVEALTREAAADWLDAQAADLPFQQSGAALRGLAAPLQCARSGEALLAWSLPHPEGQPLVRLVHAPAHAADALRALLHPLCERFPHATLKLPALVAPHAGGFALESLGFRRQALHQHLMRRGL